MNSPILERHQQLLAQWLDEIKSGRKTYDGEPWFEPILDWTKAGKLTSNHIREDYAKHSGKYSFINRFRAFIQKENGLNLPYEEAISIISEVFALEFDGKRFFQAEQKIIQKYPTDMTNAIAEWRAYFEYRFRNPIADFCAQTFPEHWLSINISLYSFLAKQTLPVYRTHLNVPDRHHSTVRFGQDSPRQKREDDFSKLAQFQKKYSSVWELVENNVYSIFYFDKSPENPKDMVVYEIDLDTKPGAGRVKPQFVGKYVADESHRKESLLTTILRDHPDSTVPWEKYGEARRINEDERAFQYGVIRFFIRSGIFNPLSAAVWKAPGEPEYKNILKEAYDKENGRLGQRKNIHWEELERTVKVQFASTKKDERKPKKNTDGTWGNFDHQDKYTPEEDAALNRVIELLDAAEPETLDVRLALFEAGFFFLTQKDNTISHIYWLPVIINWRDRETGGVVFLNSDKRVEDKSRWLPNEHGYYDDGSSEYSVPILPDTKVPQKLITAAYYFSGLFNDKLIGSIEESLRPNAERSAAVSIMSRNISHNIGSHVLSYQKNILSAEQNMLAEGVLAGLLKVTEDGKLTLLDEKGNPVAYKNKGEAKLPYLRSIGRLLGYFQERQDYISTFASDRYLYFSDMYFYRSIIYPFSEQQLDGTRNIALDRIVFSEGYDEKDIKIEALWREKDGTIRSLGSRGDYEVSLPSGKTGRQGLYTILENFIRNSAKHGLPKQKREGGKVHIRITLAEHDDEFYRLDLLDNSGKTDENALQDIQKVLTELLIQRDGTLDERHKGIKEIQIAAAWLRGIQPHQLLDKDVAGNAPIIEANAVGMDLQYTIYLRKPKPGMLLVKDSSRYYEGSRRENGLKVTYAQSLKHWDIVDLPQDSRSVNLDKKPYHFVVLHREIADDTEAWEKTRETVRSRCPIRFLTHVTEEQLQSASLMEDLYRKWLDTSSKKPERPRFDLYALDNLLPSELTIGIEDSKGISHISPEVPVVHSKLRRIADARAQKILFREHNDLDERFDEFRKSQNNLNDYLYVESISGGNTTQQLLRTESIDKLWHLKMVETALTKVVIIDERIWRNNLGKDETERDRIKLRWDKKNIHLFSLEYGEGEWAGKLVLVDLKNQVVATVDKDGNAAYTEERYREQYRVCHIVSMHQGLMERALKHCGDSEQYRNLSEKDQVDHLFSHFKSELFVALFRAAIHSGRSKAHIMPERSAFVQLSSLNAALEDCKFALCELFYSTIQENQK